MVARATRPPGNLPAELSSFIGRRRELQEVKAALSVARLVTLVWPGGVGKTRLALRSATDLRRGIAFPTSDAGHPRLRRSAVGPTRRKRLPKAN